MKKLLLHVCCAPCSTSVIESLKDKYEITLYFYNPNIYPEEEHKKRLEEAKRLAEELDIPIIEGWYDPERWAEAVRGLEGEPEGGKRCAACFEMRLRDTAEYALEKRYDIFAATLTVSPYKDSETVNAIGEKIASELKIEFMPESFKKNDGYKKSIELSKKHNLYRQHYCGCRYSLVSSLKSKVASPKE